MNNPANSIKVKVKTTGVFILLTNPKETSVEEAMHYIKKRANVKLDAKDINAIISKAQPNEWSKIASTNFSNEVISSYIKIVVDIARMNAQLEIFPPDSPYGPTPTSEEIHKVLLQLNISTGILDLTPSIIL